MGNCLEKFHIMVRTAHHELMAAAGEDARPTGCRMIYPWAQGPGMTAPKL